MSNLTIHTYLFMLCLYQVIGSYQILPAPLKLPHKLCCVVSPLGFANQIWLTTNHSKWRFRARMVISRSVDVECNKGHLESAKFMDDTSKTVCGHFRPSWTI